MKKEKSCGIVVFDNNKVLIIHHNNGHYGFPKGHVEENETEYETAIREVKEETNCDAKIIDGFRSVITYSPRENVMKDVVFFVGEPLTNTLKPQEEEVSEAVFVDMYDALNIVTYQEETDVLKKAIEFYKGRYNNA